MDSNEIIVKSGEWFTTEVIINDHITLRLNGETILDTINGSGNSGSVGFSFYGHGGGAVQIRKIEVMELPSPL